MVNKEAELKKAVCRNIVYVKCIFTSGYFALSDL